VTRVALREPDLPMARLDGPAREVKLLIDHREDLVRERVRMQARLRWHLHELFPGYVIPSRTLRRGRAFAELGERLTGVDGTVARIARELLCDIRELTHRANQLEREITRIVRGLAPALLSLKGCGALSAAKIVGEAAGADRFKSKAAFARWNGTAPVPACSGATRFRLSPGREPADQRRPAPHRLDAVPGHRPRPRLPQHTPRRRRQPDRSDAHAPPPALRRGIPPSSRRREHHNGDLRCRAPGRRLT
jgi:Transposase IS116/IS110/IS902 family